MASSAVSISRCDFSSAIFLTPTSRGAAAGGGVEILLSLGELGLARFRASWRSWYSRSASRSSARRRRSSPSPPPSAPSPPRTACRPRRSWIRRSCVAARCRRPRRRGASLRGPMANCELSNSTTRSPALDRRSILGHPADLELELLVRGTERGSPFSASSSPESSIRWRKVPRCATRAPAPQFSPPPERLPRSTRRVRQRGWHRETGRRGISIPSFLVIERIRRRIPCPA